MTKKQRQHNGAKIVFSTNGAGTSGHAYNNINLGMNLTPFTKINSKWITGLNVRCKTIEPQKDNMGEKLNDFDCGDDFLNTTPNTYTWFMKEIIDRQARLL